MKVITQIIEYFRSRGELSKEQLDYLQKEGFYKSSDSDRDDDFENILDDSYSGISDGDFLRQETAEEDLESKELDWDRLLQKRIQEEKKRRAGGKRGSRKRSSGKSQNKNALSIAALRLWIAERLSAWEKKIACFTQLTRSGDCEQAIDAINNADSETLSKAIIEALNAQQITLAELWEALSFEEYRAILDKEKRPGAIWNAYRVIIQLGDYPKIGKYRLLLNVKEVNRISRLCAAQRKLLFTLGEVYKARPELISKWLRRSYQATAYLAFLILYNAADFDPNTILQFPFRVLAEAGEPMSRVAFSVDGKTLAFSTTYGIIRLVEIKTGKQITEIYVKRANRYITATFPITFSPDGQYLMIGMTDDSHLMWWLDYKLERYEVKPEEDSNPVCDVTVSPDSKTLAVAYDSSEEIYFYDFTEEGDAKLIYKITESQSANSLAFSPNGKLLAVGTSRGIVKLRDAATGDELQVFRDKLVGNEIICFNPQGSLLAAAGYGPWIRMWDVKTNRQVIPLKTPYYQIHSLAFSPDGQTLACAGDGQAIRLFDVQMGVEIRTLEEAEGDFVKTIAFSPDGSVLASGDNKGRVILWQLAKAYPARHLPRRKFPGKEAWLRAWSQAMMMDAKTATPFFAYYFSQAEQAVIDAATTYENLALYCPEDWDS